MSSPGGEEERPRWDLFGLTDITPREWVLLGRVGAVIFVGALLGFLYVVFGLFHRGHLGLGPAVQAFSAALASTALVLLTFGVLGTQIRTNDLTEDLVGLDERVTSLEERRQMLDLPRLVLGEIGVEIERNEDDLSVIHMDIPVRNIGGSVADIEGAFLVKNGERRRLARITGMGSEDSDTIPSPVDLIIGPNEVRTVSVETWIPEDFEGFDGEIVVQSKRAVAGRKPCEIDWEDGKLTVSFTRKLVEAREGEGLILERYGHPGDYNS